jgi:hypothetical protein
MNVTIPEELADALNVFLQEYQFQISGFLGITILTCMAIMIIHITKLGSSSNPKARTDAIRNILISGVSLAVLGSISFFYFFFVLSVFS